MSGSARQAIEKFNLAVTTFKNIRSVVSAGGVVVAFAIVGFLKWRPPAWVVLVVSVLIALVAGLFLGIVLANRRGRYSAAQTGFRVLGYSMKYTIQDDLRDHECVREFTLQATHDEANLFVFEYNWTGAGTVATSVPVGAPYQLLSDSRSGGSVYRRAIIGFNGSHSRGERVEISIVQHLHDTNGDFTHFLSKIIHSPMREAALEVTFPHTLNPQPEVKASVRRYNKASANWSHDAQATKAIDQLQHSGNSWKLAVRNPPDGKMIRLNWERPTSY